MNPAHLLLSLRRSACGLLCIALLAVACTEPDAGTFAGSGRGNLVVGMNIETRDGNAPADTPENPIRSLRIYAFRGDRQVGNLYLSDTELESGGTIRCWMDLTIPAYSEPCEVVFYTVANENELYASNGRPVKLEERMSRQALDELTFTSIGRGSGAPALLPMARRETLTIDPRELSDEIISGHESHHPLTQRIDLNLERCVGKVEMYFARRNEQYTLTIRSVSLEGAGRCDYAYLFRPTDEQLQGIPHTTNQPLVPVRDKRVAAFTEDRTNHDNYEHLTADAPVYLFENPYGSDNPDAAGHRYGHTLRVRYSTSDDNISEKTIYLPAVERNTCYRIWCYIEYDGLVFVEYRVDEWIDTPEANIDFDFPNFDFWPFENPSDPDFDPYDTETHFSASGESAGSVRFNFIMKSGTGWTPSLEGYAQAFDMKVYEAGYPETEAVAPIPPSDKTYTIEIAPVRGIDTYPDEQNPEAYLCIRTRMWNNEFQTLGINRNHYWPPKDAKSITHILITQGANI